MTWFWPSPTRVTQANSRIPELSLRTPPSSLPDIRRPASREPCNGTRRNVCQNRQNSTLADERGATANLQASPPTKDCDRRDFPPHRQAARPCRLRLRERDRGRQARAPDQLVLPQPR